MPVGSHVWGHTAGLRRSQGSSFVHDACECRQALQLLVFSGVIRRANVEPPRLGAETARALQPSEEADNLISASSS